MNELNQKNFTVNSSEMKNSLRTQIERIVQNSIRNSIISNQFAEKFANNDDNYSFLNSITISDDSSWRNNQITNNDSNIISKYSGSVNSKISELQNLNAQCNNFSFNIISRFWILCLQYVGSE